MTKTPQQMAEEYVDGNSGGECSDDTGGLRAAFLAGYEAAKDQLQPQPFHAGADVYIIDANNPLPKPMPLSIAEQDRLADGGKVMPQWISVKKRLPDYDRLVLLWHPGFKQPYVGSRVDSALMSPLYWWRCESDWYESEEVITHWMPLPEAPEENR